MPRLPPPPYPIQPRSLLLTSKLASVSFMAMPNTTIDGVPRILSNPHNQHVTMLTTRPTIPKTHTLWSDIIVVPHTRTPSPKFVLCPQDQCIRECPITIHTFPMPFANPTSHTHHLLSTSQPAFTHHICDLKTHPMYTYHAHTLRLPQRQTLGHMVSLSSLYFCHSS